MHSQLVQLAFVALCSSNGKTKKCQVQPQGGRDCRFVQIQQAGDEAHTRNGGRGSGRWHVGDGYRLIAGECDVELTVVRQVEGFPDGLGELFVSIWPRPNLEAVCPAIEIDVHDSRRIGTTLRRQRLLPVWQLAVTELTVRLLPAEVILLYYHTLRS